MIVKEGERGKEKKNETRGEKEKKEERTVRSA